MLLSIIIPVYNVEDYIQQCIESVLKIELSDMEIIVVDDLSEDGSIAIVERFKDYRIKIVNSDNKGLSGARNTGIKFAKGEFIYFIDSDDYLINQYSIIKMINLAIKNNLDLVIGNGFYYWSDVEKRKIYDDNKSPKEKIINNVEEYIIDSLKNNYYQDMVWLKIYRKSLLIENKIFFSEGKLNEDVDWTLRVFLNSKKIGYLETPFYMYRRREGSITMSDENTLNLAKSKIFMAKSIKKYSNSISNVDLKNVLNARVSELYFAGAMSGRKVDKYFFKSIDKIKLYSKTYSRELRKWIFLYNISPEITYRLIKFLKR
ncbi:glycosyltransferase [Clostridium perfringens]|uniref:glycosyltransferase n=1 Tax=Clostridium perfringens TaxID=1502 RepID=UPI0018975503|nr:glycosyltransferase [Clostridium perfringens]MDM0445792.1 glycosyltransferase [Clostridium perfringens]MDM0451527.1 glycosyltransferase [Clostridium perfringens]